MSSGCLCSVPCRTFDSGWLLHVRPNLSQRVEFSHAIDTFVLFRRLASPSQFSITRWLIERVYPVAVPSPSTSSPPPFINTSSTLWRRTVVFFFHDHDDLPSLSPLPLDGFPIFPRGTHVRLLSLLPTPANRQTALMDSHHYQQRCHVHCLPPTRIRLLLFLWRHHTRPAVQHVDVLCV